MSSAAARFPLDAGLLEKLHEHDPWRFPVRLATFLLLYVVGAVAAVIAFERFGAAGLVVALPACLLSAASLHGISLFTHEAVHGVLSSNPHRNAVFGALCAWPVLQNFSAYRVLHLRHHAHLGVAGDPDHYDNYSGRGWLIMAMHWGRLLLGYPAYLLAIPVLGWRAARGAERWYIAAEVCGGVAFVSLLLVAPLPPSWLVFGWLIPMVFINTLVNIRGMSQHTLLDAPSEIVAGTRTILGTPLSRFFMCNENYHLEHHLYAGVPWYHLPALHAALRPGLEAARAPYIAGYLSFVRDFVMASLSGRPRGTVTLHPRRRLLDDAP